MRIFVANLPHDVAEENLRECFEQWGSLGRVTLMRDPAGNSRRFGFVDLLGDEEAQACIDELDGKMWGNKRLHVEQARPVSRKQPA